MRNLTLAVIGLVDIFLISISAYSYSQNKVLAGTIKNKKLIEYYNENVKNWQTVFYGSMVLVTLLILFLFLNRKKKFKKRRHKQ